jgi:hypothetical protein
MCNLAKLGCMQSNIDFPWWMHVFYSFISKQTNFSSNRLGFKKLALKYEPG